VKSPLAAAAVCVVWVCGAAQAAGAPTTFTKDVAPILQRYCGDCHHPDGPAPFSLLTYQSARPHARQILDLMRERMMPPWRADPAVAQFVGQPWPSDRDIATIAQWVAVGAPEGDRVSPERGKPSQGRWRLGQPDLIVSLDAAYALPADGSDVFRVFVLPIPIVASRFVRGIEFDPGNARVVHHVNIRLDRTPASRDMDAQDPAPGYDGLLARSALFPDGHFLGWTPGQVAPLLPKGLAWRLDAGTDLVLQVHMRPSGQLEQVKPAVAFFFGNDPPERTPAMLRLSDQRIDIAAGDAHYEVRDRYVLPVDVEVQSVQPHAHYRAREVEGVATLPDGSTRWLIKISNWDFNWQHLYRYVSPFWLPKGTTLEMRYVYDNSTANPRNPVQPPARAEWGQRSAEEMGDLWIQVLTRSDADLQTLTRDFRPKAIAEDLVGYEQLLARTPDDAGLHDDAAVLDLELGKSVDAAAHFARVAAITPQSAPAHFNLGTALTLAGRLNDAIDELRRALTIDPGYTNAQNNLGNALSAAGRPREAIGYFLAALATRPAYPEAHYGLGLAKRQIGDRDGAVAAMREAVRLKPDWLPPTLDLAWILASTSESPAEHNEALQLAERGVALTANRDPAAFDVLAVALASRGEFRDAINAATTALRLSPNPSLAADIHRRLDLYRSNEAYRVGIQPAGSMASPSGPPR
jgi:tetratricopeptide (TPR) repeat protein